MIFTLNYAKNRNFGGHEHRPPGMIYIIIYMCPAALDWIYAYRLHLHDNGTTNPTVENEIDISFKLIICNID